MLIKNDRKTTPFEWLNREEKVILNQENSAKIFTKDRDSLN